MIIALLSNKQENYHHHRQHQFFQIIISNNANKPIYEQITSQIKAMIMSGELQAGAKIAP